jgi:hypothetical protein
MGGKTALIGSSHAQCVRQVQDHKRIDPYFQRTEFSLMTNKRRPHNFAARRPPSGQSFAHGLIDGVIRSCPSSGSDRFSES